MTTGLRQQGVRNLAVRLTQVDDAYNERSAAGNVQEAAGRLRESLQELKGSWPPETADRAALVDQEFVVIQEALDRLDPLVEGVVARAKNNVDIAIYRVLEAARQLGQLESIPAAGARVEEEEHL